MGVTYKPEDARRRRIKDKALKDLDPSLMEPTKKLIESHSGEDLERKPTKRSKKTKDLKEKK
jgi:hypothetical protein